MSDMRSARLPNLASALALGGLGLAMAAPGCIREVISGEDPQAKPGRLTGKASKDQLVVRIPWMETPPPRLLTNDAPVATETVFTRTPQGALRFTLRAEDGASAVVDARSRRLPDDSMEFTYQVASLPPGYALEVGVRVTPEGIKPAIDLRVNGAPVFLEPGTEAAFVQLARDAATRITAVPRPEPEAAPPAPSTPRNSP